MRAVPLSVSVSISTVICVWCVMYVLFKYMLVFVSYSVSISIFGGGFERHLYG